MLKEIGTKKCQHFLEEWGLHTYSKLVTTICRQKMKNIICYQNMSLYEDKKY